MTSRGPRRKTEHALGCLEDWQADPIQELLVKLYNDDNQSVQRTSNVNMTLLI
jgi:hypothetical protein